MEELDRSDSDEQGEGSHRDEVEGYAEGGIGCVIDQSKSASYMG